MVGAENIAALGRDIFFSLNPYFKKPVQRITRDHFGKSIKTHDTLPRDRPRLSFRQ